MDLLREKSFLRLEWGRGEQALREVLLLRQICFPSMKALLTEADLRAQHLLVRNSQNEVCGAYRIMTSNETSRFESEDDFNMGVFLSKQGVKVELAWACVHPDYRDGRVIHLLWRGLSDFFKAHQVRYVFGLASFTAEGADQVLEIIDYLKRQNLTVSEGSVQARNSYFSSQMIAKERPLSKLKRRLLPSLLRAYLMAGALVCLQPVFDPDLGCFDFMTVLDVEAVSSSVVSHFQIS